MLTDKNFCYYTGMANTLWHVDIFAMVCYVIQSTESGVISNDLQQATDES